MAYIYLDSLQRPRTIKGYIYLGFERFDRGVPSQAKSKRKLNCNGTNYQCGSVCLPAKKNCNKGDVNASQDRLKRLGASAKLGDTSARFLMQKAKDEIKRKTSGKRASLVEQKIDKLRDRIKNLDLKKVSKGGLAELDPSEIEADPKRFQYKMIGEHTKTGEVGSLSGVQKYDPNLAGIVQVWKDPADGKTYVVNGHNRLALAKRLGAEEVAVRYLDVPDAKTARSVGAMTNIAEGRGTALDAAKFFRDTGLTKDDIEKRGIPMREKIAQDGLALSSLEDGLFRQTIDGKLPMERATIIGGSGLDHSEQKSLASLIEKEQRRGRKLNNDTVRELVDTVKSSGSQTEQQFTLFGVEESTRNLAIEKAQLQASIKRRLSREKRLFSTVGKSRAAEELGRAGNRINVGESQRIADQANETLAIFDQLKNMSGPVASILNQASERIARGEDQRRVEKEIYAQLLEELPQVIPGRKRSAA